MLVGNDAGSSLDDLAESQWHSGNGDWNAEDSFITGDRTDAGVGRRGSGR